jgi:H+/Cl- antiporter ClcA
MAGSISGAEQQPPSVEGAQAADLRPPRIRHVLLIAIIVGLFAVAWLIAYSRLSKLIWENSFVEGNRWTIPVLVLFISLLVGLAGKYMHAPNVIEGDAGDTLKAGDVSTYRHFWGTLVSSFLSLVSGASVGPEGALGFLAVQVSEWLASKFKFTKEGALGVGMAGMASAYNGIIGNPMFSTLLATEGGGGGKGFGFVGTNLAAGAVGYLVFSLLNIPAFAGMLTVGAPASISVGSALLAAALGLLGALLAVYTAVAVMGAGRVLGALGDQPILRIMVAAVLIAAAGYLVPETLFSGESVIHGIMASPATYGVGMLVVLALLKPLLLGISLKSGYLGGPMFPALFTAVMAGLAISLVAPAWPISILVPCLQVAVVTLLLRAPLTAILLVGVVTGANGDQLGLITISAATSLGIGALLQKRIIQRKAQGQPAPA